MKKYAFLFIVTLFLSCGTQEKTYTEEIIDGVKHIHNLKPKWGEEQRIRLELITILGNNESSDENYLFYRPMDVTMDQHDNIYILDRGNYRIQKFDKSDKYLKTIGRQGQGPGEFRGPQKIGMINKDLLYVADRENLRVEIFDSDGKRIKGIKLQNFVYEFMVLNSGEIIARFPFFGTGREMKKNDNHMLTKLDETGNEIINFGKLKISDDKVINDNAGYQWMINDENDNIYLNYWHINRIEKYNSYGELQFIMSRKLPQTPGMNRYKNLMWDTDFSLGIAVDHKNRIWSLTINRNKRDDEDYYEDYKNNPDKYDLEIFDGDGILLTKIKPGIKPDHISIVNDKLFLVDRENGLVYMYNIVG